MDTNTDQDSLFDFSSLTNTLGEPLISFFHLRLHCLSSGTDKRFMTVQTQLRHAGKNYTAACFHFVSSMLIISV